MRRERGNSAAECVVDRDLNLFAKEEGKRQERSELKKKNEVCIVGGAE